MAAPLIPCPSCARHVRSTETICPFCTTDLPTELSARAVPGTSARLGRAAAFVFGASLLAAGCASSSGTNDAAVDAPADASTPDDNGGSMTLYGLPPADSGNGGLRYGAPPPDDAG